MIKKMNSINIIDSLKTVSEYRDINKLVFAGNDLLLTGVKILENSMNINVLNFRDINRITALEKILDYSDIPISLYSGVSFDPNSFKNISRNIISLELADIGNNGTRDFMENLPDLLRACPNMALLSIYRCNFRPSISTNDLLSYPNLSRIIVDGKTLRDNNDKKTDAPESPISENEPFQEILGFSTLNGKIIIDLNLYDGTPVSLAHYNQYPYHYLTVLLPSEKKLNDINITDTDSINSLTIIGKDEDGIIELNNRTEIFLKNFTNIVALKIDGCTPNLELFSKFEELNQLELNNTSLYNSNLNCIPKLFKKLKTINITNCKNITDVSVLSQLDKLKNVDVSDNRIIKGIDLLLSYVPINKLVACNNLITNNQIEHLFTSSLTDVNLSGNPITVLNIPKLNGRTLNLKFEKCLLSSIITDSSYRAGIFDPRTPVFHTSSGGNNVTVTIGNNPFLEPNKYIGNYDLLSFHAKKESAYKEIMMLIDNVPENEKHLAYIMACKKYYNNPEKNNNSLTNVFNAYIGTLALMGIVNIDNDFYYCEGNNIVPIMEEDPTILLQDKEKSVSILDSYLETAEVPVAYKKAHVYRTDANEPKTLDFKDDNMLSMFVNGLKHRLPDSLFFEFTPKVGSDVYIFELPKQLVLSNKLPNRKFDKDTFSNLLGNIKIKFIKEDGSSTFINIPNLEDNQLVENVENKNRNIVTIKNLIGEEFFYLEDATDSDIVISNTDNKIDSFITFLTSHLPHEKIETSLEKVGSMQAISNSFNLNSYTSILRYGYHLQQEVTEQLNALKSAMGNGQAERISSTLKRLDSVVNPAPRTNTLEIVPVNNKRGFFSSLFRIATAEPESSSQYDNTNSETQEDTIETIKEDLKSSAEIIMNGISTSKLTQDILNDYANKLRTYIDVAKHKLESCINDGDTDKEQIRMLEDKIQSLEISELLSKGTSGQFEILVKNNARLFERVCQATQLIPVLTSQSILRSTIDSQNQILATNTDMYSYTQYTLISNANALKNTTEATENQENPAKMLKAVIDSVDEIAKSTKEILNKTPKPQLTGIPMLFDTSKPEELVER